MAGAQALAADGTGSVFALDGVRIRSFDAQGWCWTAMTAPGKAPTALAATSDGRVLAVLDPKTSTVTRILSATETRTLGAPGSQPGQFSEAQALAMDEAGRIYVLDSDLCRVTVFGANGDLLFTFGSKGSAANQLYSPERLAVSPDGSTAWVYDSDNRQLKRFQLDQQARTGTHILTAGSKGTAPGQFKNPVGLAVDRAGLVYVLDDSREDLQVLDVIGASLQAVAVKPYADLGLPSGGFTSVGAALAVAPDGWVNVVAKGKRSSWRWWAAGQP